jgi:uncharacterized membrane protein
LGLAALLTVTGVAHFAVPHLYDAIIPHWVPGPPRAWTLASGAAELACALGIALPSTRRLGATAAAILFVAVFPANIQMAMDSHPGSLMGQVISYGRLPLQIPLVAWALWVRRRAEAP